MRSNLEDVRVRKPRIGSPRFETTQFVLTGTFVIPSDGSPFQFLDPSASDRTVFLPAITNQGGQLFYIANLSATNVLNVVDSNGVAVGTVVSSGMGIFVSYSLGWRFIVPLAGPASGSGEVGEFVAGTGIGSQMVFRAIVGSDLPNPTPTTLGGLFSLAVTSNSVLSGIGTDGVPTRATTTGTGDVVRATSPSFTSNIDLIGNSTPTITFGSSGNVTGKLLAFGTSGNLDFFNSGGRMMLLRGAASAINYLDVQGGAATGGGLTLKAVGGDADVALSFSTFGAGAIGWYTNNFSNLQVQFIHTAGANRNLILTGSNGGNPTISTSAGEVAFGTSVAMTVAAKTLVLKQGANGACGTFVANGATPVTVNNTNIATTDSIIISLNTVGGTVGTQPHVATITAATSFTVVCTALDTSTYNYAIIKNAA